MIFLNAMEVSWRQPPAQVLQDRITTTELKPSCLLCHTQVYKSHISWTDMWLLQIRCAFRVGPLKAPM